MTSSLPLFPATTGVAPNAASFVVQDVALELGGRAVLADLNLTISAGERLAVIGPSGAGKTSLLRLLSAAILPTRGQVTALSVPTAGLSARELLALKRQIGVLHQSDNLVRELRVVHNVLMGRLGSWSLARAAFSLLVPREIERARAALEQVELEPRLWDYPGALSGGEQQRVALARLLVQDPRAILADEPASALDPRLARDIAARLSRLASEGSRTLVVSLHALELIEGHFDSVLALQGGRALWRGSPSQLTPQLLRDLYGNQASQWSTASAERGPGSAGSKGRSPT